MTALATKDIPQQTAASPWINTLAYWFSATDRQLDLGLRTTFSCAHTGNKPAFYLPPEMAVHQADNLRYLHALASKHDFRLIEDRRSIDIKPFIEQRSNDVSPMMQASIELLKQTGMKSRNMAPSYPNRLNDDGVHVPLPELIELGTRVAEEGKRVVVLPNAALIDILGGDTHPIVGYAANIHAGDDVVTVAYFDSPKYRSIGYRSGDQFINHVLLGGGPTHNPDIWAAEQTLIESNMRFQLYRSKKQQFSLGLMSASQFIDL